mmetsp:Transcript_798/g.1803  ORF Transcript_798/g.1803 Transcript_798/m.1803 type:complete len:260 (-) Transcript_798:43-822(-)
MGCKTSKITHPYTNGLITSIELQNWNDVVKKIKAKPKLAKEWGKIHIKGIPMMCLPIHGICDRNPPSDVLTAILEAYPEGVRVPDHDGSTPLHYACFDRANISVIKILVKSFPNGVKMKNKFLCLPIHLACWRGSDLETINFLIHRYPESIQERDMDGDLAIHDACQGQGTQQVIKFLIDAYPESLRMKNKNNVTPYTLAKARKTPDRENDDEVLRLFKRYPRFHSPNGSTVLVGEEMTVNTTTVISKQGNLCSNLCKY